MRKIIFVILGISLLIGLLGGYLMSETKYYYSNKEITYKVYKRYFDKSINWESDYSIYTTVKKVYNTQSAILFGLTALGILLVMSYFYKPKEN